MDQVIDFFRKLLDTSDWPPRWHCGHWTEFEGWMYIISDMMIWMAYFAIPLIIMRYVIRRYDARFKRLYFLFAAFILFCGITHFVDAVMFWLPVYRLNAFIKLLTALVSWTTVIFLIKYLPLAFASRSVEELEKEIARRQAAEEQVRLLNLELEKKISDKIKEIQDTDRKFKTIFENSSEAISLMDESFKNIYSNEAARQLSGRNDQERSESDWSELIHPEDRPVLNDTILLTLKNPGVTCTAAVRISNKQNGYLWIEGCICNLLDDPAVCAMVFSFRDVTAIRTAEIEIRALNETLEKKVEERTLQLEAANKELESFSYSVSHDLRAPLRIINGYADMLLADNKDKLDAEGLRVLDIIMYNTRYMGKLIDALLNLARMGRKELFLQQADMASIIGSTINEQMSMQSKPVNFTLSNLLPANCDSVLMRHVWNNLISNAIKYSGNVDAPEVQIWSEIQGEMTVYAVKDNGVGFDMKYSDKLFGVFQRLHKKTDFDGTGIGLALVQRIVLKHGGRVWAEAEENKGATFYFSIPN